MSARGITLTFGPNVIQHDLSFDACHVGISAVIGDSGCGQSTVLKSIIGLLRPRAGTILVERHDYLSEGEQHRAAIGGRFGVLFQTGTLWSALTAFQDVAIPMQMFIKLNAAAIRRFVRVRLALVDLEGAIDTAPAALSGSMRRRAGLARALAFDLAILFFDEPAAGLDPITSRPLDDLILNLRDGLGATIITVSHELPSLFAIAGDGVFLDAGTKATIAQSLRLELKTQRCSPGQSEINLAFDPAAPAVLHPASPTSRRSRSGHAPSTGLRSS